MGRFRLLFTLSTENKLREGFIERCGSMLVPSRIRLQKSVIVFATVGCTLSVLSVVYHRTKGSICHTDHGGLSGPYSTRNLVPDFATNFVFDNNSSPQVSPKRYMFSLRIPEQLTMSSIHFHQFLNLVDDWNFTGVEPYIYGSTMYGLRSLHSRDPNGSVPFGLLFNSTKHNAYLSKCMKRQSDPEAGHPILFEPMSEFLHRSYRRLVLVYFASHENTLRCSTQVTFERLIEHTYEEGLIVDCTQAAHRRGVFNYVEDLLIKEMKIERLFPSSFTKPWPVKSFKAEQAFCVKQDRLISLKDVKRYVLRHIKEKNSNEASIIFVSWQGRFTHPIIDSDIKNYINKCRLPFSQPLHSDFVMNTAKLYVDSLGFRGAPYLSVHVRFEKLFYYAKNTGKSVDAYLDCCVRRLNSLLSAVMSKLNISMSNVLLHWDYSPYGSLECPVWWCSHKTNKHLKKIKAVPSYFEPMKFDVPINHGLISLVEMNALLGGKALVTVGEGSYQTTIIDTFIQHHHDPSNPEASKMLHYGHLCIPPENLHDLTGTIVPEC